MRLVGSELALRRAATVAWLVGMAVLVAAVAGFFPALHGNASLNVLYADLPAALQGLLGGADLVSPVGYLSTQMFAFVAPVVLLILGMGRGAAALAGEEEDRTLDLLLAQPVSRRALYGAKAVAVTIWLTELGAVTWGVLAALDSVTGLHVGLGRLAATCLQMTLMCLAASWACMAIAAGTGRRIVGIGAVAYYLFLSYLVYGLSGAVRWLGPVRPLTVWRWYLGNDPLVHGVSVTGVGVLLAVSLVATGVGAAVFDRRDVHA